MTTYRTFYPTTQHIWIGLKNGPFGLKKQQNFLTLKLDQLEQNTSRRI